MMLSLLLTLTLLPAAAVTAVTAVAAAHAPIGSSATNATSVAATPPMGWNSWNHYHCAVNEDILRNISRLYTTTGVAAAGYEYVNIDDCWQAQFRDTEGRLQADPHIFPSGIKKLCSDIHAEGNKFGIYVDSGYRTCQDRPGTLDNEFTDAQTFADWGVDYVKNDACYPQTPNIKGGGINQNLEGVGYLLYERFFSGLKATGRPMFFSIENPSLVAPWDARNVSNARRVGGDIGDGFGATLGEFHTAPNVTEIRAVPGQGGFFNDLDMLEIGNGRQNKTEYTTQFSLWCIAKAPLLLGCDLSNAQVMNGTAADAYEIFLNKEAIAISQDPLAMPASRIAFSGAVEVWAGPLEAGGKVLLFLNGGSTAQNAVQFPLSLLGDFDNVEADGHLVTKISCRDVWLHAPCSSGGTLSLAGNVTVDVPVHGVRMLRLTPITNGGLAQALTAKYEISAEDAVAAAEFAAAQASKFRTALAPPKHAHRRSSHTQHQPHKVPMSLSVPMSSALGNSTRDVVLSHPTANRSRSTNAAVVVAMRGLDSSHTGRSPYKGPSQCPTTVKWINAMGHNNHSSRGITESSVAVHQSGLAFVGSGSSLWAVSMSDGATIWKFDTAVNTSQQSEFFSTPAIAPASSGDDLVIAGTGAGTVYAFSVADGSLVWSFETGRVVIGMNGGTGRAPVTGSVVLGTASGKSKPETAYVGAWDGCVYAFDTMTGKHKWKYQAMDADSGTAAQVRATPAVSADGTAIHFPAGRALYAIDAATGKERWVVQTKQVIYTSPTVAPSGTVIYGASGGGLATAVSVTGKILWTKNMTTFHSTMGAITSDEKHVLLISGNTPGCGSDKVSKLVIDTGEEVWPYKTGPGCGVGNVNAAALTIDASGTAWLPSGSSLSMTNSAGNHTVCQLDTIGGANALAVATIAGDGMLLLSSEHGELSLLE